MIDLCHRFMIHWPRPHGNDGWSFWLSFSCPLEKELHLARNYPHSCGIATHF